MNALKHGLRARSFGLLPEESTAEWTEHVADLRRCYDPVDSAEEKLVTAIAVAMWNEIRADRTLVETMVEIPPRRAGRSHGTDMAEPEHARALGTALRYLTAVGMATQRAQRAFLVHRKAKQAGLIVRAAALPTLQNCTTEMPAAVGGPAAAPMTVERTNEGPPFAAVTEVTKCTNDLPHPSASRRQPEPMCMAATSTPLNRHQRRRREALARQARHRAA